MQTVIIFALLPVFVLLAYIYKKDPNPEPMSCLVKATMYGVLTCLPVATCELLIQHMLFGQGEPTTFLGTISEAFLVAAIPEETVKLLALWLVVRHNPFFDEHFDGIVYAVCVSLGFAAVENVFYLVGNMEQWQSVALGWAFLAVPGHYAFGVLMGYYYSVYHFGSRSRRAAIHILAVPVLGHGVYDMLAMGGMISPGVGAVGFVILLFFCFKLHEVAKDKITAQVEKDREERFRA